MPRHRSAKSGIITTSDKEKYRQVQAALGEEESNSDESFRTPPTDENVTDYRLDYTSRSTRNMPQPARSPQKAIIPQRSPSRSTNVTRSYARSNPLPDSSNHEEGPSTSYQQQRSPKKSTGSARRKGRLPKRRNHIFKEIGRLQSSTKLLIPRMPFVRLVREILHMFAFEGIKITPTALEALQEATEIYLTTLLADSYRCTLHRDRVTLQVKDIELARYLRGRSDPGNY